MAFKKLFRSIKLTVFLLLAIIVVSIIGTIVPQGQSPQDYIEHYGQSNYLLLNKLGILDIYRSPLFLFLLFLLFINLIYCLSSRPILKRRFLGFTLTHLGFMVILLGAIIGSIWGEKGYIQIYQGQTLNEFSARSGEIVKLPFTVKLEKFSLEYYPDSGEKLLVKINPALPPYNLDRSRRIGGVKDKNIEKELKAEVGREYTIDSTNYHLKIEKYLPDFSIDAQTKLAFSRTQEPNNPALLITLTNPEGKSETRWIFARFPEMQFNQQDENVKLIYQAAAAEIKSFKSKLNILENEKIVLSKTIEVNHPLTYKGYHFYQASYDREQLKWSGLQVGKDPGVPVVYSGFSFIIIGLIINFYFKGAKK